MMLPSATHLPGSYDPLGEILSIVTAVAASYTALDLAGCVAARKGWTFATCLVGPLLWALAPCPCTSRRCWLSCSFRPLPVALSYSTLRLAFYFREAHKVVLTRGGISRHQAAGCSPLPRSRRSIAGNERWISSKDCRRAACACRLFLSLDMEISPSRKAGAIEFLTKPFRDQDLLDAIHKWRQKGTAQGISGMQK